MNWKIQSKRQGNFKKMCMALIPFLFCFLPLILFGKNNDIMRLPSPEQWEEMAPYLLPEDHPLKQRLDTLFSKTRVLQDRDSLIKAGFIDANARGEHKVIVSRHTQMPGYIFKMFADDKVPYYHGRPEFELWLRRVKGAEMVRQEIVKQGWQAYFKAPIKWIYPLPATPKAKSGYLQKNFIVVEEDMQILPKDERKIRWKDGTITPQHLPMLFHLITTVGLWDSCAPCNIPICKDGRIAFIDTQAIRSSPPKYFRLFPALNDELSIVWERLVKESEKQLHSQKNTTKK